MQPTTLAVRAAGRAAAALFIPAVLALAVGAGLFWLLRAGPGRRGWWRWP